MKSCVAQAGGAGRQEEDHFHQVTLLTLQCFIFCQPTGVWLKYRCWFRLSMSCPCFLSVWYMATGNLPTHCNFTVSPKHKQRLKGEDKTVRKGYLQIIKELLCLCRTGQWCDFEGENFFFHLALGFLLWECLSPHGLLYVGLLL